jgi:hypothetical protein
MLECANVLKLLYKELANDGSCVPKHAALCDMTLKYFAGRLFSLCL